MIGKVMTGKSFGGCVRYNLERPEATILHAEGLRAGDTHHIIDDFNLQRKMNPELGKGVGHIVLSWSKHDVGKLTAEIMAEQAKEYLQKMKITNTQFLVIQHTDREHPHLHIVYNRVDNNAKTISDQYQRKRNAEVCKQLTRKHGYYMAAGKVEVKQERLTGADKIKYQIYHALSKAAANATSWKQLESLLKQQGIGIQYKYRRGTNEVQGISFSENGTQFKGSEIDRGMSFQRLHHRLEQNWDKELDRRLFPQVSSHTEEYEETEFKWLGSASKSREPDLLSEMLKTQGSNEPPPPELIKRKKKRKYSQGLSR
ncbi:relaxase/mobilization nuclease domain-containing protein [Hufsiella ginkgonis]|uniref:Relaxase/mobilization nuclease domain-containing protein n=1 Tax=Hufsiella ginkgonis TaxID=2695274 RepID=A0A7K1XST4_9SPHI|nr:relaxase/mobilization nuclease domain-containing protein [Hufsiella ginkgonis]MXV14014.1 relaxase/mobilization nuclease domain-containing protein [Hufsiella ginkgonis]